MYAIIHPVIIDIIRHHFQGKNKMKFKCVATIYDVYHKVNEISVERVRRKQQRISSSDSNQSSKWVLGNVVKF